MLSESPRVTRRKRGSFSEFDTNGDMVMPSSPFGRRRSRNPPDVGNQRDTNELFKVISQDESRERNPSLGNLGIKRTPKYKLNASKYYILDFVPLSNVMFNILFFSP